MPNHAENRTPVTELFGLMQEMRSRIFCGFDCHNSSSVNHCASYLGNESLKSYSSPSCSELSQRFIFCVSQLKWNLMRIIKLKSL